MSVRAPFCFLLFCILHGVGCGGIHFEHEPISYSPLADMRRTSPVKSSASSLSSKAKTGRDASTLRQQAVSFAKKRLSASSRISDFGQTDLEAMFTALNARVAWSAEKPLSKLLRAAERRKAFDAQAAPLPGDVVLFHNQTDRNRNSKFDDWLTGCGIVSNVDGPTFSAVVRTGHGPRLVYVTPRTPAVRTRNGRVINSFLRVPSRKDPPDAEYLSGLLFAGCIDLMKLVAK